MTDRELLELAARAGGFPIGWDSRGAYIVAECISGASDTWNPLTDDSDALRLAVKLGLEVSCDGEEKIIAGWPDPHHEGSRDGCTFYSHVAELKGTDPYAATRRVIVRAAAAIGEKQ